MSQDLAPAGMDERFAASSNAVKALIAIMGERWPNKKEAIDAWRNAYIEKLCGLRPSDKPLLTPDEIKAIARDVMRDWMSPSSFPLPGTFGKHVDEFLAEKRQAAKGSSIGGERLALAQAAFNAGQMYRRWSYVYERYPASQRYYRATRSNGELMSLKNGEPMMIDHWGNAEHFKNLYDDAMRQLTGDAEAQRSVEELVAQVEPWNPPREPVKAVRGFRTLGEARTPRHVSGGPGEQAAAKSRGGSERETTRSESRNLEKSTG